MEASMPRDLSPYRKIHLLWHFSSSSRVSDSGTLGNKHMCKFQTCSRSPGSYTKNLIIREKSYKFETPLRLNSWMRKGLCTIHCDCVEQLSGVQFKWCTHRQQQASRTRAQLQNYVPVQVPHINNSHHNLYNLLAPAPCPATRSSRT